MFTIRDDVRFSETDMMGVVYHPNYLHWMEMGRIDYLKRCGVTLNELMADGILFPITEVSTQYKNSLTLGDSYEVQTTMSGLNKAKMEYTYKIIRLRDGAVAVEGYTRNLFTDTQGKIKRLPDHWFKKINDVYQQEEKKHE
ncbi:MAG: acyl-CoA thioesterase [Phascolarctobacterium sp.]|nr:acyl-CoA thioesterase [Phascolarctobacterium sp.]